MMVKTKKHMRAIDSIADGAMLMINTLEAVPEDAEEVAINPIELQDLCYGYMHLYVLLMEAKQMPTPTNQQKFHSVYH